MRISKENRKIVKHFASILWWYLFGLGTLAMIIVYYFPLSRDFGSYIIGSHYIQLYDLTYFNYVNFESLTFMLLVIYF